MYTHVCVRDCLCAVHLLSANNSNIFLGFNFHFTLTIACLSSLFPAGQIIF